MLNYRIYGSGQPLVILHGLFGMLDNWSSFARSLQDQFQVILVDQRNHGKSFHSSEMSYSYMASDLQQLLIELTIPKAHIIGHSMGGKAALHFAVDYPELVDKLIVVDITTAKYNGGHHDIFRAIRDMDLSLVERRQDADEQLAESIHDFATRQFLLKNLARKKERGFRWKANFESLYQNYPILMDAINIDRQISATTLFVRGTKSDYIPTDETFEKKLLSHFIDARIIDINAGHWIHAEKPKELLEVVTTFLE